MVSNIVAQVASLIKLGLATSSPHPIEAIPDILNIPIVCPWLSKSLREM